ncbi:Uncharacterized protein FWK35_00019550 [Aphis craccivora]|uniref:Uncharacterized protein n=1 Tax=Aphis craccivora TaxID=307492 RepID=A0A6G0YEM5_APHCR|nr:Uncharacterized protein FWK35_00019550 [Aphis craccivora]
MDIETRHMSYTCIQFPIGIKAKFTHKLQEWQKCNSIVNLPANNISSLSIQQTTPPSIKICLQEVLNSTTTGKMILDYYKINNKFNNSIRTLLVDVIISYIITKQIPMSVNLASSIGSDIVKMFQSEVKDTYFMKDGLNKNPKGKLYAKYYNSMRTLKISGLVSKNLLSKPYHTVDIILNAIDIDFNTLYPNCPDLN